MIEGDQGTLHFDPDQNAIIDTSDGSIIPLDVLGSGVESLPRHIQNQIQCKRDEDFARTLSERHVGPKVLGTDDFYVPLDVESRPSRTTWRSGYMIPKQQPMVRGGGLEQEIIEMHSLYPGGDSPAVEERSRDADWSLARALQSLEFEIIQDTYHDPLTEEFNEKEYRASSCKRQLMTFSTFVCLVQVMHLCMCSAQSYYSFMVIFCSV